MSNKLLKPEDVAEKLGMSPSWVYANKAKIGFVKVGTALRFESDDVTRYALSRKRGPQHEERKWESQSDTGKSAVVGSSRKRTTVSDINARLQAPRKVKSRRVNTPQHVKLQ
jgi:predicted DNA-binding transcriptional regulator AlpA